MIGVGGYQMVDMQNVLLTIGAAPVKIDGLYEAIIKCRNKCLMLTNINLQISDYRLKSCWAIYSEQSNSLQVCFFYTSDKTRIWSIVISVNHNDEVIVTRTQIPLNTNEVLTVDDVPTEEVK